MQRYLLKRLGSMVINIVLVSVIIFAALRLIPTNIAAGVLGQNATPAQYQAFNHVYGLDQPAYKQFLAWAGGVLRGDFGKSFRTNISVINEFEQRLPITLEVVLLSFSFA